MGTEPELYTLLPPGKYPLILAAAFWAIGNSLGWTVAWLLGGLNLADQGELEEWLKPRASAFVFWLYVLFWVYGALGF